MKTEQKNLQDIKQKNYTLDFGEVFNDSLENYKKVIWISGLALLLLGIVMLIIFLGIFASVYGISSFVNTVTEINALALTPSYLLFTLIVGVLLSIAISPLYAGILQISHNAQTNKPFDLNTAFQYYKSDYLKQIAISSLLIALFSGIVTDLITLVGFPFIGNLFTYFIQFITLFTIPFIIFGNLNATDSIQASISIVFKKFWLIFVLLLVAGILSLMGTIAICIGIFFTLPIIYTTQYTIYRKMIGIEENDELDEIGKHIEY